MTTNNERELLEIQFKKEIEAFDADPANKHFGAVYERMAVIFESSPEVRSLKDVYDQAVKEAGLE